MLNKKGFMHRMEGARFTMQRLSDAKIVHGWVKEITGNVVVLRDPAPKVTPGDRFQCRVPLNDIDSVFVAEAVASDDGIGLMIEGLPKAEAATGDVRYAYDTAKVTLGDTVFSTIDISPTGLGTICPISLPVASYHRMVVSTGMGDLTIEAEVRSRRSTPDGRYRIGFRIHAMDRIDRGRWNVLISSPEYRVAPRPPNAEKTTAAA